MENNYMKMACSLVITDIKSKTTIRYYYTPNKAQMKRMEKQQIVVRMWNNWNSYKMLEFGPVDTYFMEIIRYNYFLYIYMKKYYEKIVQHLKLDLGLPYYPEIPLLQIDAQQQCVAVV